MKIIRTSVFVMVCLLAYLTTQAQDKAIVILKDISNSIASDSTMLLSEQTEVKGYLMKHINETESASVYSGFLFSNSSSPLNVKRLEYIPKDTKRSKRIQKLYFLKNAFHEVYANQPVSDQTHILSSLRHVSKAAHGRTNLALLLLSDCLEYSPLRKMTKRNSFGSLEEAEKQGKRDAENIMKRYRLEKNTTTKVEVLALLPLKQTDMGNMDYLFDYWLSVYSTLFASENITLNYQTL